MSMDVAEIRKQLFTQRRGKFEFLDSSSIEIIIRMHDFNHSNYYCIGEMTHTPYFPNSLALTVSSGQEKKVEV